MAQYCVLVHHWVTKIWVSGCCDLKKISAANLKDQDAILKEQLNINKWQKKTLFLSVYDSQLLSLNLILWQIIYSPIKYNYHWLEEVGEVTMLLHHFMDYC